MPVRQSTLMEQRRPTESERMEHLTAAGLSWSRVEINDSTLLMQTRKSNCTSTVIAMIALKIDPDLSEKKWFRWYYENGALTMFEREIRNFEAHCRANHYDKFGLEIEKLENLPLEATADSRIVASISGHVLLVHAITEDIVSFCDPLLGGIQVSKKELLEKKHTYYRVSATVAD